MKPSNLIIILSDQHNPRVMGCAGHALAKTPNIDALAARGTRFSSAYTNCPICVPARASLATGRYVHEIRFWDNAIAYRGTPAAWGHRLMEKGHRAVSIGKLHYQDGDPRRNGFDEEILPMHIVGGVGDLGLETTHAHLVLAEPDAETLIYVCGPERLLEGVEAICSSTRPFTVQATQPTTAPAPIAEISR